MLGFLITSFFVAKKEKFVPPKKLVKKHPPPPPPPKRSRCNEKIEPPCGAEKCFIPKIDHNYGPSRKEPEKPKKRKKPRGCFSMFDGFRFF